MGIPLVSYCIHVPRPLFLLVKFLSKIRLSIAVLLSHLVFRLPPDESINRAHRLHNPVREQLVSPSTIKGQLPVTEFTSISSKLKGRKKSQSHEAKHLCIVCLENLEQSDEVRVLGNCVHAFHRECIDHWIDIGQAICPLCRAQLVPSKHRGIRMLLRMFS